MTKRGIAKRSILEWIQNSNSESIKFEDVETKVYELCRGLSYSDTMKVFKYALNYLNK